MPSICAVALATPAGGLERTVDALLAAEPPVAAPLAGRLDERLLRLARDALAGRRPDLVLLATTKAETARWCDSLIAGPGRYAGGPGDLAARLGAGALGAPCFAVSAACASSPVACAIAARALAHGRARSVLVLAGDEVGPFISDGFAALGAIDPQGCRPFDRSRAGLALGETSAALLLSAAPADGPGLSGWGGSLDANHLTGPTRDGSGLERALSAALHGQAQPALVIGHGTGTRYNDDSESLAYARAAPGVPVVGLKGYLGHSLGACGLAELAIATALLTRGEAPGTVGLREQGCAGAIRVLPPGRHALAAPRILLANAGFGGMNGARCWCPPPPPGPSRPGWRARRARAWRGASTPMRTAGAPATARAGSGGRAARMGLPVLGAEEIIGRIDMQWGRMDLACRATIALGMRVGPLPEHAAVVFTSARGCAESDRAFERGRRARACDPQQFAYTLPTAPVGEASIRLRLRGPGCALLGANEEQARAVAWDLMADGCPGALIVRMEADDGLDCWAEAWLPEGSA